MTTQTANSEKNAKNNRSTDGNREEELTSTQLQGVSGGRTNGDDPLFQVFLLAAKATFYQGMWYAYQGW